MQLTPSLARLASGGLFVWAAATLSLTGAPACETATPNSGQTPCPPGQVCSVNLTLLHTADIHSRLLPYQLLITQVDGNLGLGTIGDAITVGGAARMGYILKRERAKSDRVLHLSGGDVFEGAPIFNFFNGEPEMRVQAALHVDAAALANHEFDRGAANVARQIQKWADFPVLAANYIFSDPALPTSNDLNTVIHPFTVLDAGGLKVAVIGMGNLSSLTSVFNTPNSFGIHPINTVEAVQFYVDLLRPLADVIVIDSHLGLQEDQAALVQTTGVDVWLGSHNHIVIDPPEQVADCAADPQNPGYIWVMDPNLVVDENQPPPNDALHPDPINHPYEIHRPCFPRTVILAHSGAFSKYVGRLDLVLSNDPNAIVAARTGAQGDAGTPDAGMGGAPIYDPTDGFEVLSSNYQVFPISDATMGPEEADPEIVQLLEPYQLQLQALNDLTTIAGYSPNGARRIAPANGDSPLGNVIAAANWLRVGVQTDFALTNTTGIRQDLLPGPVTIDEAYDIFPFDNTITTMYLSGTEIFQLYDFVARTSATRGCVSQAQIAGSRVVLNCSGCTRTTDAQGNVNVDTCMQDTDCPPVETLGTCNTSAPLITDPQGNVLGYPCAYSACAQNVYIGFSSPMLPAGQTCSTAPTTPGCCRTDADCKDAQGNPMPNACNTVNGAVGTCMTPVVDTNVYELATSNYLAGGGSGYRVLQRNTTQHNTFINQRDAMLDYIRQGPPCGWQNPSKPLQWPLPAPFTTLPPDGLTPCQTDNDCSLVSTGGFVCACTGSSTVTGGDPNTLTCASGGSCSPNVGGNDQFGGRCIPGICRDSVAEYRAQRCAQSPAPDCLAEISPCDASSQICQIIACVDSSLNAIADGRVQMTGN